MITIKPKLLLSACIIGTLASQTLLANETNNPGHQQSYAFAPLTPAQAPLVSSQGPLKTSRQSGSDVFTLGMGWSTDQQAPAMHCLLPGTVETGGTPSGSTEVTSRQSYQDLLHSLDMSASGTVGIKSFSVSPEVSFVQSAKSNAYRMSFIYKTQVQLKSSIFLPVMDEDAAGEGLSGSNFLSHLGDLHYGQGHGMDFANFQAYCGDSFVKQIDWGGRLYVIISVEFNSKDAKTKFESSLEGSYGSIASIEASLKIKDKALRQSGYVTVKAMQIGGDPTELGKILSAENGEAPIASCSLDEPKACIELMSNVANYAAHVFPEQFHKQADDIEGSTVGAAPIGKKVENYAALGIKAKEDNTVTPEVLQARRDILAALNNNIDARNRAEAILREPLSEKYRRQVESQLALIRQNRYRIDGAGIDCFASPDECVENVQNTLLDLHKINNELLDSDIATITFNFQNQFKDPLNITGFLYSKRRSSEEHKMEIIQDPILYPMDLRKVPLVLTADRGSKILGLLVQNDNSGQEYQCMFNRDQGSIILGQLSTLSGYTFYDSTSRTVSFSPNAPVKLANPSNPTVPSAICAPISTGEK